eukprot:m.170388 g.170388  ORF g.170388 m.170388 type:complete len:896 (-) comp13492_c0_seq4:1733-4420(-)
MTSRATQSVVVSVSVGRSSSSSQTKSPFSYDVDLNEKEVALDVLSKYALAGVVHLVFPDESVAFEDICEIVKVFPCEVEGSRFHSTSAALSVLSEGALRVCVPFSVATAFLESSKIPCDRISAIVTADESASASASSFSLQLTGIDFSASLKRVGDLCAKSQATLSFECTSPSETIIKAVDEAGGVVLIPATALNASDFTLGDAISSILTTDRPDGLWTTVVVDEQLRTLGVCYSNKQSLKEAVSSQSGVYWSRKRGLWNKGLTSGDTQTLKSISYDCDRDLLQFQVVQHGKGFCHRGIYSCMGERSGISRLEATLKSRVETAVEGSYTRKLINDNDMLQKKVVEEAIELCEAKEKNHVASEMADLLYFSMVVCARAGVTFAEVEKKLDRRHLQLQRRQGKAKPQFLQEKLQSLIVYDEEVKKQKETKQQQKQQQQQNESNTAINSSASLSVETNDNEPEKKKAKTIAPFTLKRITAAEVPPLHRDPVDAFARGVAEEIMKDVSERGEEALLHHAVRLGDIKEGEQHIFTLDELKPFYLQLSEKERGILERTAERIRVFAESQLSSIHDVDDVSIPGGKAGQFVAPVEVAGCYAPGGRYPLPSSVLMGAVTARVAGVKQVWVASPRPHISVLAAAYIAKVDGLLAVGGCQAIAAFSYGCGRVPPCDAIVGPGNRFVTAAKSLVAGSVCIDMLAGPSECLVVADSTADAEVVASDLIAQAEHDVAARSILVTEDTSLISKVEKELEKQLQSLPTAETARVALLKNSFAVVTSTLEEAIDVADRIAPEHLEVHTANAMKIVPRFSHYGALFVGHHAAEVLGDYGAGPNHTLPTGGTARSFGGLSVHTFLRQRTWMRIDDLKASQELVQDAVDLALIEGLHGHSRSAEQRLLKDKDTK